MGLYKTALKAHKFPMYSIQIITRLIDTILPPRCVGSGVIVDRQGMLAPKIWAGLDFIGEPQCAACGFPFDFEMEEGTLCGACLEDLPPFTKARSALKYNEASRGLVLGFKHGDKTHAVRTFVPWLKQAGAEILAQGGVLVPVPLHPFRLISRRYNQSALIAQALARETGLPLMVDGLRRVRATPSQGHLKVGERHANVKKAFAVNPNRARNLLGQTVIVVDDVYTTGATVKECAKTLLKGGVKAVYVLTLARVLKE